MQCLRSLAAALLALGVLPGCGSSAPRSGGNGGRALPEEDPSCAHTLTAFAGDCRVPPALDPSEGFVAHYGPSDYDDPDEVEAYVLEPGKEVTDCAYSKMPGAEAFFYDRYDVFSRPGAHHVILYAATADVPDGTRDNCAERDHGSRLLAVLQGAIDGSVFHYPPSGTIAPENAGLATELEPNQTIAYELHAVNATEEPILRETWTQFFRMPKDQVKEVAGQMAWNGGMGMDIPPHTRKIVTNSCTVSQGLGELRIVDFFGHMHSHGERFSAWAAKKDASGNEVRTLIYESYDWSILDLIELNSVKKNTPVEYESGTPGGMSGILALSPGDRIDYECEFNNTENYSLTFAARAFTAEMCNLFGSFAPARLPVWMCIGD